MMNRRTGRRCVLVVDNDDALTDVVRRRLEAADYECVTASTGAMGIAVFEHRRPDMVITDLNMPMGSGFELVETIRRHSSVPILIMTGYRPDYGDEIRRCRGITIFEKPFDGNELVDRIDSAILLHESGDLAAA